MNARNGWKHGDIKWNTVTKANIQPMEDNTKTENNGAKVIYVGCLHVAGVS